MARWAAINSVSKVAHRWARAGGDEFMPPHMLADCGLVTFAWAMHIPKTSKPYKYCKRCQRGAVGKKDAP